MRVCMCVIVCMYVIVCECMYSVAMCGLYMCVYAMCVVYCVLYLFACILILCYILYLFTCCSHAFVCCVSLSLCVCTCIATIDNIPHSILECLLVSRSSYLVRISLEDEEDAKIGQVKLTTDYQTQHSCFVTTMTMTSSDHMIIDVYIT